MCLMRLHMPYDLIVFSHPVSGGTSSRWCRSVKTNSVMVVGLRMNKIIYKIIKLWNTFNSKFLLCHLNHDRPSGFWYVFRRDFLVPKFCWNYSARPIFIWFLHVVNMVRNMNNEPSNSSVDQTDNTTKSHNMHILKTCKVNLTAQTSQ